MQSTTQNISQSTDTSSQKTTQDVDSNACSVCNKVSIYNMVCRCGLYHCKRHRDPTKHNCSYDFSGHANNQNSERLQKIEPAKITAI